MRIEAGWSRIIVAADFSELGPAVALAEKVGSEVFGIKVGSEFAEAVGAPQAVEAIVSAGSTVFRDLKTYDIKNTDTKTMAAAVRPGVTIINMHALNGKEKMAASAEAVRGRAKELGIEPPLVLAVTILTDMDFDNLIGLGFFANIMVSEAGPGPGDKKALVQNLVVKLAKLAHEAGLDGVICSAQEATLIRQACGPDFLIATPGIRPADAPLDDQKRTLTPREAIEAGADLLVIGRPITGAADPLAVVKQFNADIAAALEAMKPKYQPRPRVKLPLPPCQPNDVYLRLLRERRGYYHAVIDPSTNLPIGPLVAYSGIYTARAGNLQFVGFKYYNCAMLEQDPEVVDFFAQGLASVLASAGLPEIHCLVGVPEGGLIIAQHTARHLGVAYAGMQKKVIAVGTTTTKEQTELVLKRHSIEPGMTVVGVEDLFNNFATTDKGIEVMEKAGGNVIAMAGIVNRSWPARTDYNGLPVHVLLDLPTPQYRQEDEEVCAFLEKVHYLADVKPNWATVE